ncbi:hypothetical protein J3F83DRAFT_561282 [Trichoderma novae-zelandiae]
MATGSPAMAADTPTMATDNRTTATRQRTVAADAPTMAAGNRTTATRQRTVVSKHRTTATTQRTVVSRHRTTATRQRTVVSRHRTTATRQRTVVSRHRTTTTTQRTMVNREIHLKGNITASNEPPTPGSQGHSSIAIARKGTRLIPISLLFPWAFAGTSTQDALLDGYSSDISSKRRPRESCWVTLIGVVLSFPPFTLIGVVSLFPFALIGVDLISPCFYTNRRYSVIIIPGYRSSSGVQGSKGLAYMRFRVRGMCVWNT